MFGLFLVLPLMLIIITGNLLRSRGFYSERDIKTLTKTLYWVILPPLLIRTTFISGREVNLTAKEFDLLELLVKNENKVYSRENLLGLVWGKDYPGDVRTVDVHVRRLREKIETNPSEPKYVHTKWGVGYYYYQK